MAMVATWQRVATWQWQRGFDSLAADVRDAMDTAWNEICSDTGCHPLDLERRGGKLYFEPRHWADLIARMLVRRGWQRGNNVST
jgi:hypothetical protein